MRIAVFTLTRDRLEFTKHCFATLQSQDVKFDHYIYDNASEDGTQEWLATYSLGHKAYVQESFQNDGLHIGLNYLMDWAKNTEKDEGRYDYFVRFDNDCELLQKDTLRTICCGERGWVLAPRILGLNNPPSIEKELIIDGMMVGVVGTVGGICMAVPRWVYDEFRYNEGSHKMYGEADALCSYFRNCSGHIGYVMGLEANHYMTTEGQKDAYPEYWERKVREFNAVS